MSPFLVIALSFSLILAGSAVAEDVVTLDFPITAAPKDLPARLREAPRQVATPEGQGYVEISLQPQTDDEDLLVTVVFAENGGKGPSLSWFGEGGAGQKILSEDLAEGVTGANQRTVQVPSEFSSQAGRLIIFGDQSQILRVRLDWTTERKVMAAADQRPVSFIVGDRLLQNTDLSGKTNLSPPDAWFGQVFEAFLQEEKESLDQPVEFALNLEHGVKQAVLTIKILGLPLDQSVQVWINDHRAGQLAPTVPALTDAGYLTDKDGNTSYAGWRTATLFLPRDVLHAGENAITLVAPGGPVFIRDASLQLRAPEPEDAAPPGPAVIGVDPSVSQPNLSSIP